MATTKIIPGKNDDIHTQLHTLREDVAHLAKTVTDRSIKGTKETANSLGHSASVKMHHVGDQAHDLTENFENRVKHNPLTAVTMAAGLGVLVGMMTRR